MRFLTAVFFMLPAVLAQAQPGPYVGQPGKDVVWVPTPPVLVEKMLDMAKVTSRDYVIDLGSGDGRNVIAAAKRGARALGVEYDRELLALARKNAIEAGVGERARFVEGDMFEADISGATVLALFLLPDNLQRLKPKFSAPASAARASSPTVFRSTAGRRRRSTRSTATAAAGAPPTSMWSARPFRPNNCRVAVSTTSRTRVTWNA